MGLRMEKVCQLPRTSVLLEKLWSQHTEATRRAAQAQEIGEPLENVDGWRQQPLYVSSWQAPRQEKQETPAELDVAADVDRSHSILPRSDIRPRTPKPEPNRPLWQEPKFDHDAIIVS